MYLARIGKIQMKTKMIQIKTLTLLDWIEQVHIFEIQKLLTLIFDKLVIFYYTKFNNY